MKEESSIQVLWNTIIESYWRLLHTNTHTHTHTSLHVPKKVLNSISKHAQTHTPPNIHITLQITPIRENVFYPTHSLKKSNSS